MKVNLTVTFVSGSKREYLRVDFPTCKTVEKIRTFFNKSVGFIWINGIMIKAEHIEEIEITDYEIVAFDEKLQQYRDKNPEYKKEN